MQANIVFFRYLLFLVVCIFPTIVNILPRSQKSYCLGLWDLLGTKLLLLRLLLCCETCSLPTTEKNADDMEFLLIKLFAQLFFQEKNVSLLKKTTASSNIVTAQHCLVHSKIFVCVFPIILIWMQILQVILLLLLLLM